MRPASGLSLLESLLALALVSVLGLAALPALNGGLEAARAADARATLLGSLTLAVHRSTMSGTRAVLCPSTDGNTCADDPDWSPGWLVFMDNNANRELDGDESILRTQKALAGQVRLRSTLGRTRIVFQGSGSSAGSNVSFTLCDGRGPVRARALIMSNTGGLRDGVATAENLAATCPR